MDTEFQPIRSRNNKELSKLLARAFADYFVPFHHTPETVEGFIRENDIEVSRSYVAVWGREDSGIVLVARRQNRCRLAGMAVVPEARNHGIGTDMICRVLADCRSDGMGECVLEVITKNDPAIHLYEKWGFSELRRLAGYSADAATRLDDAPLDEIDLQSVVADLGSSELPDIPWQISAATVAMLGSAVRGFRCGDAVAAIVEDKEGRQATLRGLSLHNGVSTSRMMDALVGAFPDYKWRIPALYPEEIVGRVFESRGFTLGEIGQIQMSRTL